MSPSGRARADRLRAVPLEAVLRRCGGEPDRHDACKWHTAAGMLSVCGPKFMNWSRGIGGGGAIDLVMHLREAGFLEALGWLNQEFAVGALAAPVTAAPRSPLLLPRPDSEKIEPVKVYLTSRRAIPLAAIAVLVSSGDLYADARANAVFLLRRRGDEPVGAELRGTTAHPWRGMAPGSRKDLGFFAAGPARSAAIVLCESAIDAISCSILHTHYRCVSTSGARPDPLWLDCLAACASELYCGFDADPTGEHMAREMIARHPAVKRLRPALKDWNDVLRSKA